jgi:putative tryptophan/tyrosine transport system substrate-binding protein
VQRREFIALAGTMTVWPLASRAQPPTGPVIGYLNSASPELYAAMTLALRNGLKEVGYTEGQNVAVEYRWADTHVDRLPALADELVRRQVAAIVSTGGVRSNAVAVAATKTIPVIFITGTDPVKLGWVQSLNHPGGNVTGVSFLSNGLEAKRLGLLHDAIPHVVRVGILLNPENPTSQQQTKDLTDAGQALGLTLQFARVTRESDIEPAVSSILQNGAQGVVVATDANFINWREQLLALIARARVPAIFHEREFAVRGGLMSYGASFNEAHRLAGIYAGRILKGDKVGDLPVQRSTRVEFVINLATAKSLGLNIPSGVLAITDEAIE